MAKRYICKQIGWKKLFFVCGEECFCLSSEDGESVTKQFQEDICSLQEEADTRIYLHYLHICRHFSDSAKIVVRSPDTDALVLLLKFAQAIEQSILFDTGTEDKRRLLSVKAIIKSNGAKICSIIPPVHSFTGCDTTSSFVKKGKVLPLRCVERNPSFVSVFEATWQDYKRI